MHIAPMLTSTDVNIDLSHSLRPNPNTVEMAQEAQDPKDASEKPEDVPLRDCVDIASDDEVLVYVGTTGRKATNLNGVEKCLDLKKLHVRSNLVTSMAGLAQLEKLEQLELYDNHVKRISDIQNLRNLQILDLSFNHIRKIPDLSHMGQTLTELYIANNKVTEIGDGLKNLTKLRKLDLGANRLRLIQGLDGLVNLKELWLGKNKITVIGNGLEHLAQLEKLSVQSNRLTQIDSAALATNLHIKELYLSHNGLVSISGLGHLSKIEILDVGANRLKTMREIPVDRWANLTDLWMSHNAFSDLDEVEHLQQLPKLETLYLEFNPLAKDFEYRKHVQRVLNDLEQLDAVPLTHHSS